MKAGEHNLSDKTKKIAGQEPAALSIKDIRERLARIMDGQPLSGSEDEVGLHQEFIENLRLDPRKSVSALLESMEKARLRRQAELTRLAALYQYEEEARLQGYRMIAGTDEAGRGPIAGPVVAAAVILPQGLILPGLNDSKKLSAVRREALYHEITAKALAFSITEATSQEIDRINILQASNLAMARAVEALAQPAADFVLVDGLPNKAIRLPQMSLTKGDSRSASIAAASILAKVHRDRLMDALHQQYPQYGFASHKGYLTAEHIEALRKFGVLEIHRKTFTPVSSLL